MAVSRIMNNLFYLSYAYEMSDSRRALASMTRFHEQLTTY